MRYESEWLLENLVEELVERMNPGAGMLETPAFLRAEAFVGRMQAADKDGGLRRGIPSARASVGRAQVADKDGRVDNR